ncbi:MAG TPA: LapA family protein [Geminicoccaceae bacterium]|nr:LapA family protein [Geminicoccaceae bacterium]
MTKLIRILLAVVVGLVIIVFSVANRGPVEVSFAPFPTALEVPLYGVALMFLFLGVLAGGIAAWLNGAQARGENRRLRRRLTGLETQVDVLKRQLAEAEDRRVAAAAAANTPDGVPPPVVYQGGGGRGGAEPLMIGGGARA